MKRKRKSLRSEAKSRSVSAARSSNMRAIKARDTVPELRVRSELHRQGFRFRLCRNDLPGSPDIVFPSLKRVVFVHGCFWHSHPCKRGKRTPKTNVQYWSRKLQRNARRDASVKTALRKLGWRTFVVWECQTRDLEKLMPRLRRFLED
jgi:DNA mismatch endonuclease (patch repair protein)